jgi:hypothetical protein
VTESEWPALGSCCVCGGERHVRNVIMLGSKAPVAGRGWGCLQCGLPADGAMAVVCDGCMGDDAPDVVVGRLRWACRGYPAEDGRVPVGELTGSHEHDMSRHPECDWGMP